MKIALSRRQFLWATSTGVLAAGLPAAVWGRWRVDKPRSVSRPRFFTDPADYATLGDLVDYIIPPDQDPGAKAAGVTDYIDFLLGAFLSSAPFIFAGGPFSNRNPVDHEGRIDDMAVPIALTSLQALVWRIRILGTKGAAAANPADAPKIDIVKANNVLAGIGDANGDLDGFQQQYSGGIAALRSAAMSTYHKDFPDLTTDEQANLISMADPNFIALVTSHAAEGMYGNPEYGGNQPLDPSKPATGADGDNRPIGWMIANFEGDRQPLGYTSFDPITQTIIEEPNHPVSTPDPGSSTPLDARTAEIMRDTLEELRELRLRGGR